MCDERSRSYSNSAWKWDHRHPRPQGLRKEGKQNSHSCNAYDRAFTKRAMRQSRGDVSVNHTAGNNYHLYPQLSYNPILMWLNIKNTNIRQTIGGSHANLAPGRCKPMTTYDSAPSHWHWHRAVDRIHVSRSLTPHRNYECDFLGPDSGSSWPLPSNLA